MSISVLLLVLTMAGVIFQLVSRAKASSVPGSLPVRSIRSPREILTAARQFFGDGGWTLGTRSVAAQTFSYSLRPAGPKVALLLLLGVLPGLVYLAAGNLYSLRPAGPNVGLLLLLGVLPGLVYLAAGTRSVTVTVASDPDDDGSATLVSWSNSGKCEQTCRDFLSMIRSQEPERSDSRQHGRIRRRRSARSGFAK